MGGGGGRGVVCSPNFWDVITVVLTAAAPPSLADFLKFNRESGHDHKFQYRLSGSYDMIIFGKRSSKTEKSYSNVHNF